MNIKLEIDASAIAKMSWHVDKKAVQDRVNCACANEVLRLSDPYVPTMTGSLYRSALTDQTALRNGEIHWNTDYAEYAWNPYTRAGKRKNYTTNGNPQHPLARGEWANEAVQNHMQSIQEVARRQILREL